MSGFGDELAHWMLSRHEGVRSLAVKADYSASHISRLRAGKQRASADVAARLDDILAAGGALCAAAAGQEAPPAARQPPRRTPSAIPAGVKPAEHLAALRNVLVAEDNILGPACVTPVLISHIRLIGQLRRISEGKDAADLLLLEAMYAEFCAWCAQDAADHRAASYWLDRALELAHMTLDPVWPSYILARKAQLAVDMHDPSHATGLAHAAAAAAADEYKPRLSAVAATYGAQGCAISGDAAGTARELAAARTAVSLPDSDPGVPWAPWLGPLYVDVHDARCQSLLGRHSQAAEAYAAAISGIPDRMTRDRGVYTARMAVARVQAGEYEAAGEAGLAALSVAQLTSSGRIITELRRLSAALAGVRSSHAVSLREALATVIRPPRNRP